MSYYKKLTFWQNKNRQKLLEDYIEQIKKYFELVDFDSFERVPVENQESQKIRSWLNKKTALINPAIIYADVSPRVTYTPPPEIGGYVQNINIVENFALLYQFNIPPIEVVDALEKALGVYEADFPKSIGRTLNPFFWIGRLLELIASLPFQVIGNLGVKNTKKLEKTFWGKLIKLIIKTIVSGISVWKGLQVFGFLPQEETVVSLVSKFI